MSSEHSRALLLARGMTGEDQGTLLEHLGASRVHVSGAGSRPDVLATVESVIATLRRLPVRLSLQAGAFADAHAARLIEGARAIDPARGLALAEHPGDLHIHVGPDPGTDAHLIAMPERHGGHIAGPGIRIGETRQASGLGVMSTAALVCGEAFKALVRASPGRTVTHERLSWCPVTLSDDPAATPPVSADSELSLAIVGLGAIGTAIASILATLPLTGTLMLIDPERFAPENLSTYSLGTAQDAQCVPLKTDLAAGPLARFTCLRYPVTVRELIARIDAGQAPWPRLVLAGTDSPHARRETQRLWPDRLIDGATGDTTCGFHDVVAGADTACLQCLFAPDTSGPSSSHRLAEATGLPVELLRHGDELLTHEHINALPTERREMLCGQIGKPVCGLAQAIGLSTLPAEGYRPSASFVSQQAACMVVGRLLAHLLGVDPGGSFVQYDALIGPHARLQEDRLPSPDCFCQQRADIVRAVRASRQGNALA